jgi:hypothetical protein
MVNGTIIIPVKIDSLIRQTNVCRTVNYILHNTSYDIIIKECDETPKLNFLKNDRIFYSFEKSNTNEFHRTRLINEMLSTVKTPVVVNYDADVLLPPEAYTQAENLILKENYDLVYPYGFEQFDQIRVLPDEEKLKTFSKTLNLQDIPQECLLSGFCRYGHVQFFNTSSYRAGYMENENYRHWCPEDEERGIRFQKLGYKVCWFRSPIFHQEHPPSSLTAPINKDEIYELHERLINFNKNELIAYYSDQEYIKKYKKA